MHVLAVDTTTTRGSVAVLGEEGVLAEARVSTASGHSRWLLAAVEALLGGLGLQAADLDAFAVTTGPGSFTGLRVGLSSVQGLAIASGRRCVGVSALDVLAFAASGRGEVVIPLMDAFRDEVYWGVHDADGQRRAGPSVGPLEDVLATALDGTVFVGDAVAKEREAITRALETAVFPEVDLHLAVPLGRIALARAATGQTIAPTDLRPLYLRGVAIRTPRS